MSATRETVREMTQGQLKDIVATMVGAVPSLSFEEAKRIIGGKKPFVSEIRDVFERWREQAPTVTPGTPANDEVFELTLDGDAVNPMEMVRADGYEPRNWQFQGSAVEGTQTRRFKLVRVGYCRNLDEVRQKVEAGGGTLAEGQWRQAFREKYPEPTKGDLIGFGGSRWVDPDGSRFFPFLFEWGGSWRSLFSWSDLVLREGWRWLVLCK